MSGEAIGLVVLVTILVIGFLSMLAMVVGATFEGLSKLGEWLIPSIREKRRREEEEAQAQLAEWQQLSEPTRRERDQTREEMKNISERILRQDPTLTDEEKAKYVEWEKRPFWDR